MNSKTIARNTAWYGLENLIGFVTSLITSIAIARTLGPAKMGYIIYVTWITGIVANLGSVGIPATTRKYMAEFLGASDYATSRFIYIRTLFIQASVAAVATLFAVVWVMRDAPPDYRVAALLLVLSVWPTMTNSVPAQANVAAENLSANLPASLVSTATYFILTMLAVVLHWGVIGIAFAMFSMRVLDFLVRIIPTTRRILAWDPGSAQPLPHLRARMMSFAAQSVMGMLLTLVVWDRSELFLLKHLTPDIRQLSFYSVAFNLAERLLLFPTIFAAATGASILAQYGRDRTKLPAMTAASARYIALISIPIHAIAVPLAAPALLVLYGKQYIGALLVASVAPLLCLPKAFLGPIQSLFESVDRQKFFLITTVIASFVDIGVAWYLIPAHGALGACIGSGAAQITAVGLMWAIAIRQYRIQLPWSFILKVIAISAAASLAAYGVAFRLPPLGGLIGGAITAIVVFLALAYLLKMLEPEDCDRFKVISNACPPALAAPVNYLLDRFTRRMAPDSTAV
ncbi:polysaccharide biosynthesis C-terminal domain-containing protein [Edaphobacter aggregans]|uniref:oligosaccharide flippase family protein n=1 Tax=Edaphobacter aggregans TaxID=570835 RepID=UPI000555A52B|nr:polysaccharide biosynthesis C-terminal domain-containing protein [Edaphobacter aggregans]